MGIRRIAASSAAALLIAVIGSLTPLLARAPAGAAQPPGCTYAIDPTLATLPAGGGTGSVSVITQTGCAWTAQTTVSQEFGSFVTITSGTSGSGNGTVEYAAPANPSATSRSATLIIAGKSFVLFQFGTCSHVLSPPSAAVPMAGGVGSFTVTTTLTCPYTVWSFRYTKVAYSATGPWYPSLLGTGPTTFWYSTAPNVRGRRTDTVRVGDPTFTVATFSVQQDGTAVRADFTGDGKGDVSVFRPASGTWIVQGAAGSQLGQAGDIPVPGDYDGDDTVDRAFYRPSDAVWQVAGGAPIQFGEIGDLPVPADYDGDGTTDIAVFRTLSGSGQWYIRGQGGPFALGQRGDIPVPEDYDGDRKSDLAVFRPSNGTWYIATAASGFTLVTTLPFGLGGYGDIPVPADYDGNGRAEPGIYRSGALPTLFVRTWSGFVVTANLGQAGDVPMAFDADGDGRDEFVLFRPSTGGWTVASYAGDVTATASLGGAGDIPAAQRPRIADVHPTDFDGDGVSDMTVFAAATGSWNTRLSTNQFSAGQTLQHTLGQVGDVKVPGDYDGDRKADFAVWRPADGTWHLDFSSGSASRTIQWGLPGDVPLPADYDGDGRTDLAVWRPADGVWYILDSSSDYQTPRFIQWGLGFFNDVPVPGDFDGDGKADLAVFRPEPGLWYLNLSSGSVVVRQWGLGFFNDIPLVGDFDGDGRAEITVFRPGQGLWYSMDPVTGVQLPVRQFGLPGDVPLVEDFDADGITDLTVYRPSGGLWFTQRSTLGFYGPVQWGQSGDEPLLRIR